MNKKEQKIDEKLKNKKSTKDCSNLISNHQPLISDHKAITLIALVITIIVMLILVGVTVTVALDGGLFNTTKEAAKGTQFDADRESLLAAVLGSIDRKSKVNYGELEKHLPEGFKEVTDGEYQSESGNTFYVDEYGNITTEKKDGGSNQGGTNPGGGGTPDGDGQLIDTSRSYVGCYADVDGNGTEDGIIYADLAFAGSGMWNDNEWSSFSYDKQTGSFKQYEIKGEVSSFGNVTRNVIKAVSGGGTKDRFYVMALKDVDGSSHYWYRNAYTKLNKPVAKSYNDFGEGKENTKTMLDKWEKEEYGKQDNNDMWGIIQNKKEFPLVTVTDGKWFVPSKAEWAAFGWLVSQTEENHGFGVTSANYIKFGLKDFYWSSSQYGNGDAYDAHLYNGYMYMSGVHYDPGDYVRLSATF